MINTENNITIKNLSSCREYISLVSRWLWKQWSKRHGRTLKEIIYRTEHCLTKKSPQTLIAFYKGEPAGTVSLWNADHPYRQDLGPWLSCLFVPKKYRGKKIGQALQTALLKTAEKAGFKEVYLMTDLNDYYEKAGWKFVESGLYTEGRTVKFYKYKLK
ncbi:MAG: GNAT family N-acetyltransferase [Patescibacteria group bacterium]